MSHRDVVWMRGRRGDRAGPDANTDPTSGALAHVWRKMDFLQVVQGKGNRESELTDLYNLKKKHNLHPRTLTFV